MLLLSLFACAPDPVLPAVCPTFDEIAITDPEGVAAEEDMADARAAIDALRDYSGRDGVCVSEVRITALLDDIGGQYSGELIQVTAGGSVRSVTFHELCHAVDRVDGYPSLAHPELFPASSVDVSEHYATEEARAREAFARACDYGPRSVALVEALEATCGRDLGSERQRFLDANVFSAWEDTGTPSEGTVALALERAAVDDVTWVNAGPVVGGASVYVVSEDTGAPEVLRVEPATGRVTARVPVPMRAVLLGGDMEPLVVVAGETTQAWALVGDTLVERSGFPAMGWVGGGVVVGGVAFVVGRYPDEDDARLVRVDLGTGEAATIEVPAGMDVWQSPRADASGIGGGTWSDAGERVWLGFDPTSETWTITPFPAGWVGADAVRGADGRLVGVWTDSLALGQEYELNSVGLVDEGGAWWLADQPCDADGIGGSREILWVDGEVFLWEYAQGWDAADAWWGRGHAVTRVVFE
jgi:hypothetical protein